VIVKLAGVSCKADGRELWPVSKEGKGIGTSGTMEVALDEPRPVN
jgi:hypothetical protein